MRHALTTGVTVTAAFLFVFVTTPLAAAHSTSANPAAPVSNTTGGVITTTPAVVSLVADGAAHSPTFAGIVADLLASNVLVTIEPDLGLKHGMSGYTAFVARTPIRRYLRVCFDPRGARAEQIAIIGHELWHAREVARHPEVLTQADFHALYASTIAGRPLHGRWDSDGAFTAGERILHELTRAANNRP